MSGASAGSGWRDDAPDDAAEDAEAADDAPRSDTVDPPIDNRTTQPMPRIDRTDAEASPPPSPWSSRGADTVRVEAPAWFLRAQKAAAAQARSAQDGATDPAADDPVEEDRVGSVDDEAVVPSDADADADTDAPATAGGATSRAQFLDPTIAESYREPRPSPDLAAGTIGLLGAALLSIGSLSTWARSTGVVEATVSGLTGSNGWGTLACGVVVGFGAVLVLTGRRGGLVGGSMLIAALAAVYFCGFSAVDIVRTGDELPDILIGNGIDREVAEVATLELTSGFAVVAAGAAAALAAGTIAFARRI